MLVCNVSLRPPRAGIAAEIVEVVEAADATATGQVVFATLVDDPAAVRETVDAFLGNIMLEAASAAAAADAGLAYAAAIVEAVTAADTPTAAVLGVITAAVTEPVTAGSTQDATVTAALAISGTPVTTGTEYEHGVGSSYAGFTVTASGGTAPYTYSVASGTLPSGITLNSSSGVVSGTPAFESAGTYASIVIRVTDASSATANLASFTLTIAFKDPYYSNVNLLLDYDAANGNTVFTDQKFGVTMSNSGTPQHDTGVTPLYGTSSFKFDGSAATLRLSDDPKWNLAASNFTIDFTARPTSVTGTRFWIAQWGLAGALGWAVDQSGSTVFLDVSTTGSNTVTPLQSASGALVINTWSRWRADFDGTKYRLYKDGTMVASSTTLRTIFDSAANFSIGSNATNSFLFAGNCRGIRLTKGTARTASDSGYTISNRAFPTS
jgi:hypothetical protein